MANGWKRHLETNKAYNKAERERLSKIRDYELAEQVNIHSRNGTWNGEVSRVNQKTYTVKFDGRTVSIDKESLSGYPKDVIEDRTGDGRRFIGAHVWMEKA